MQNLLLIGNKDFQEQAVKNLGLPNAVYCDSRRENVPQWIAEHTNGSGVDVFFECVGRNETYALAVQNTADIYWKILRNQLTVTGTWNSTFVQEADDDWHYVLDRLAEKRVAPAGLITHRFAVNELEQGFHIMRDKTEDYVRISQ